MEVDFVEDADASMMEEDDVLLEPDVTQDAASTAALQGFGGRPVPAFSAEALSVPAVAAINSLPISRCVVRAGYLMKRGEHIKNWRRRYFILHADGALMGYKAQPRNDKERLQPLNNFSVKHLHAVKPHDSKPYAFVLRGLRTCDVDRVFHADSQEDLTAWLDAIAGVVQALMPSNAEVAGARGSCWRHLDSLWDLGVPAAAAVSAASFSAEVGRSAAACCGHEAPREKICLQDFELLKTLGVGTFGKVVLCREKSSGCMFAIKMLKKNVLIEKNQVTHALTENRVLQACRHPFLTQLKYSFQTADTIFFVMEYVNGGELYYHLARERRFSEDRTRFYAAEIVLAIGYLHEMNVIYRDLKLENLLLDMEGHIRIADFGLCKEAMHYGAVTKTFCGTPEYLAPEILEDSDYGRSVDWWGLGVVCYEMLCGRLPFYSRDHETLFQRILFQPLDLPDSLLSHAARHFLAGLLARDPAKRLGGSPPGALEVMRHAFFRGVDWVRLSKKEVPPPWRPDVADACDTRYIPTELLQKPVQLTPPFRRSPGELGSSGCINFDRFSYYGSRTSLSSRLSGPAANTALAVGARDEEKV